MRRIPRPAAHDIVLPPTFNADLSETAIRARLAAQPRRALWRDLALVRTQWEMRRLGNHARISLRNPNARELRDLADEHAHLPQLRTLLNNLADYGFQSEEQVRLWSGGASPDGSTLEYILLTKREGVPPNPVNCYLVLIVCKMGMSRRLQMNWWSALRVFLYGGAISAAIAFPPVAVAVTIAAAALALADISLNVAAAYIAPFSVDSAEHPRHPQHGRYMQVMAFYALIEEGILSFRESDENTVTVNLPWTRGILQINGNPAA